MKPYFIYAKELDLGLIGINIAQIVTLNKGSVKTTGEEVTMVKMANGKEVVLKIAFDEFRAAIDEIVQK